MHVAGQQLAPCTRRRCHTHSSVWPRLHSHYYCGRGAQQRQNELARAGCLYGCAARNLHPKAQRLENPWTWSGGLPVHLGPQNPAFTLDWAATRSRHSLTVKAPDRRARGSEPEQKSGSDSRPALRWCLIIQCTLTAVTTVCACCGLLLGRSSPQAGGGGLLAPARRGRSAFEGAPRARRAEQHLQQRPQRRPQH
jgi:hypothetical protein